MTVAYLSKEKGFIHGEYFVLEINETKSKYKEYRM